MNLIQLEKPSPQCLNCKKYLDWNENVWKEENRKYLNTKGYPKRGEGDFGIYRCSNCHALYLGERQEKGTKKFL